MKALIIGATGATGRDLVEVLLEDAGYTEVVVFVRRSSGLRHPKLTEVMTDFDNLAAVSVQINGDALFSCLGTTLKAAGSKEAQRHIDYEIPLEFAELARGNGVAKMVLVSAYGASAGSRVFYSRIKGLLEDQIGELGFEQYTIFRPGLLVRKNTDRLAERISEVFLNILNKLGIARKFRPLPTRTLAAKLAMAPQKLPAGRHVIALDEIFTI